MLGDFCPGFQGGGGTVSVPPWPPLGPPPPVCGATGPPGVGAVGSSTCGPPGAFGTVGAGDGFGIGAALTGPTPNGSVVMAMPAAIAAAPAARRRFFVTRFPFEALCSIPGDSRRRTVWTGAGHPLSEVRDARPSAPSRRRGLSAGLRRSSWVEMGARVRNGYAAVFVGSSDHQQTQRFDQGIPKVANAAK
jgi:hypothetical protein